MDKSTHDIRLSNWLKVIQDCSRRPKQVTIKQWCQDNGISEKRYYYWQRRIRRNAAAGSMDLPSAPAVSAAKPAFAEIPIPASVHDIPGIREADAVVRTEKGLAAFSNSASRELVLSVMEGILHA